MILKPESLGKTIPISAVQMKKKIPTKRRTKEVLKPSHCCTAKSAQLHREMVQAAKEPFWGHRSCKLTAWTAPEGCWSLRACGTGSSHTCVKGVNNCHQRSPCRHSLTWAEPATHGSFIPLNVSLEKTDQKLLEGMEEDFQRGKARDTKANLLTMLLPRAVQ